MRLKLPSFQRLALLLLIVVPIVAWFLVKPVRVLAPGLVGVSCLNESICLDDPARAAQAGQLYSDALAFVSGSVSPLQARPKVIFCATQSCADRFGLGARSAVTLGIWGTVIGPRAWHDYYVRHEMIHALQYQRLGVVALLLKPSWFVEGMAYGLSLDPRAPLAEPFETYRSRYQSWYGSMRKAALWQEADKL
jgi:hypothetical protein